MTVVGIAERRDARDCVIRECEEAEMARDEIVAHLEPVRRVHARSPFVERGYAGDFETVEYLMSGTNRAFGPLARACETYALSRSIAQQHRNTVRHQAAMLLRTTVWHRLPACALSPVGHRLWKPVPHEGIQAAARSRAEAVPICGRSKRGDVAEELYRRSGWTEVGVIPGYALDPDGSFCDTVVFYKAIS